MLPGEHHAVRRVDRLVDRQRPLEVVAFAEIDAVVVTGEDDLDSVVEDARFLEERAERRGCVLEAADRLVEPGDVDRPGVRVRPADAGALHDRRALHVRPLLELRERQCPRTRHASAQRDAVALSVQLRDVEVDQQVVRAERRDRLPEHLQVEPVVPERQDDLLVGHQLVRRWRAVRGRAARRRVVPGPGRKHACADDGASRCCGDGECLAVGERPRPFGALGPSRPAVSRPAGARHLLLLSSGVARDRQAGFVIRETERTSCTPHTQNPPAHRRTACDACSWPVSAYIGLPSQDRPRRRQGAINILGTQPSTDGSPNTNRLRHWDANPARDAPQNQRRVKAVRTSATSSPFPAKEGVKCSLMFPWRSLRCLSRQQKSREHAHLQGITEAL